MEFHEKLQHLRKQKNLTQEELAQALYVSRTAISKWESGRGYPNIDSLKAISRFFCVSIDELLSGEEVLTIAQADQKQQQSHFIDLSFGLLDVSMLLFFFLPLFGQAVSLLALKGVQPYLKTAYYISIVCTVTLGVLTLALQNVRDGFWTKHKSHLSLICSAACVLLFIISRQTYAASLAFVFCLMKAWLLFKNR